MRVKLSTDCDVLYPSLQAFSSFDRLEWVQCTPSLLPPDLTILLLKLFELQIQRCDGRSQSHERGVLRFQCRHDSWDIGEIIHKQLAQVESGVASGSDRPNAVVRSAVPTHLLGYGPACEPIRLALEFAAVCPADL